MMDEFGEALILTLVTFAAVGLIVLVKRVASLEEDLDLMHIAAGSPKDLLEAKRMITKRAVERDIERGML
jgi:hypothetical protein